MEIKVKQLTIKTNNDSEFIIDLRRDRNNTENIIIDQLLNNRSIEI